MKEAYCMDISGHNESAHVEIWFGIKPIILTREFERNSSGEPLYYLSVDYCPKHTLKERIASAIEILQPVCDWINKEGIRMESKEAYREECSKIIKEAWE